jgi:hypothetical protein
MCRGKGCNFKKLIADKENFEFNYNLQIEAHLSHTSVIIKVLTMKIKPCQLEEHNMA